MSDVTTTPEVTPALPNLKEILLEATKDLYYPSESDEPFEFVEWVLPLDKPLEITQIIELTTKPVSQIKVWSLADCFGPVIEEKSWFDEYQKSQVFAFKNLLKILQENLSDIQVFRAGEIEIDVYIVGKSTNTWAGVKTMLVET